MSPEAELHRLINLAIQSHRELHPENAPDLDPADYDTLYAYALAARERARTVARPVIVRTIASMFKTGGMPDADIRKAAADYLGEHWDYFNDNDAVVRRLLTLERRITESCLQNHWDPSGPDKHNGTASGSQS